MTLTLNLFDTPAAFAGQVMTFLIEREAEHCLLIGITAQAIENPARWDAPLTFATVECDGVPVAVAIRTPPFQPVISRVDDHDAIPLLVELFVQQKIDSVLVPVDVGALFATQWSRRTGQSAELARPQRIYKVEHVRPVRGVPGSLRTASQSDLNLLVRWNEAFVTEAFGEEMVPGQAQRTVETRLTSEQSGFALWEDGKPVCMVGYSGPTPDGIRIGPVYTPPEHRRRGYASAATATLSQRLIDEGRRFCVLFTDLDNPTSNHIYQEIGYEPVADVGLYRFSR
jgi:uncharacterized protein